HGEAHDPLLVLPHEAALESRRSKCGTVSQVETMLDRRTQPVEVRDGFLQPPVRLPQLSVDLLKPRDVLVLVRRLASCFVLRAQLLQERNVVRHRDSSGLLSDQARQPAPEDNTADTDKLRSFPENGNCAEAPQGVPR